MSSSVTHVLVVDDDPLLRSIVCEAVEDEGYLTETARNGREALAKIRAHCPDAVLTDLMMPIMDGWALIQAMRDDHTLRALPVGVISASYGGMEQCRALGVVHCVAKPFDLDDLLSTVQQLVSGR